jgi:peroxiredoxin 2/4
MIGLEAPNFKKTAVLVDEIIEIDSHAYRGKYLVLFFYPLDFTFVCPTELHEFQKLLEDFRNLNAEVVGCSVDSQFCHKAWLSTEKKDGGIKGIKYPLISDVGGDISRLYGVLAPNNISYRGTFIIDKSGFIRHMIINDLPLGRNPSETLRTLEALIHVETNGEVCPANWNKTKRAMKPNDTGLKEYFSHSNDVGK